MVEAKDMLFTDLRVQNFRSYRDASFEIGPGVTIVVGPNAAGKTNLIEALMLAATGNSYRGAESLIAHGQEWGRIDAHTADNALRSIKLRVANQGQQNTKEFEIDSNKFKRLPVSKRLPVVLFEPNDLQLLHGDPSGRREYMDTLIEQLDTEYKTLRNQYKRTLSQRNALLKHPSRDKTQLFTWNVKLVELASATIQKRLKFVTSANKRLSSLYSEIAKKATDVRITYKTSADTENYATALLRNLEKDCELDYARGFTSHGPHRDDLLFLFDGQRAADQASRGEIRTLLLSLKIIELELLEEKYGARPLLLLDDVFSELDGARRRALTSFLKDRQTIITTTDADVVIKHFTSKCTIIPLG